MATVRPRPTHRDKLAWYFAHCNHTNWDRFSLEEQEHMVSDDLEAGRNVSIILFSLITAGLVLSAVTLAVVLATS